jgi:GT2 family glycosyltransferase
MYPKVTVSVVYYNSMSKLDLVTMGLKSLRELDYPNYEVILVDNGSADGTYKFLTNSPLASSFKVIRSERNTYWAGGNNLAFRSSSPGSRYYLLVNPDAVVEPWALRELVERMEAEPKVGACQGQIRRGYPRNSLDVGRFLGENGWIFDPARFMDIKREYLITYPAGALTLVRGDFPRRRGFMFRELPIMGFDDNAFGIELYMNGYTVKYYPIQTGYHEVSAFTSPGYKDFYSLTCSFLFLLCTNSRYGGLHQIYFLSNYLREHFRRNALRRAKADPSRFTKALALARELAKVWGEKLDIYRAPYVEVPESVFLLDLISSELRRRVLKRMRLRLVTPVQG